MWRAGPALLLPPPALPGKHQRLELGPVASQQKVTVLSVTWRSSLRFPVAGHCAQVSEWVTRGTCTTSHGTDGAEVGCSPGHPIHPLPGPAGGDVIW